MGMISFTDDSGFQTFINTAFVEVVLQYDRDTTQIVTGAATVKVKGDAQEIAAAVFTDLTPAKPPASTDDLASAVQEKRRRRMEELRQSSSDRGAGDD